MEISEQDLKNSLLVRNTDLSVIQKDKDSPYSFKEEWEDIIEDQEVVSKLYENEFNHPSSIQGSVIPIATKPKSASLLKEEKDKGLVLNEYPSILAQAQNGSGKTLAFVLTTILRIESGNKLQAVILVPTLELAIQTSDYFKKLRPDYLKYTTIESTTDIDYYGLGQLIISTPGCLFSIYRHIPGFKNIKLLVIDECDEIIDNTSYKAEFLEFSEYIKTTQFLLFSATLKDSLKEYMDRFLPTATQITLPLKKVMNTTNQHFFIRVKTIDEKITILTKIYEYLKLNQTFIFVRTKRSVASIQRILATQYNLDSEFISGERTKKERKIIIKRFRDEEIRVLITTDLLARGVDIPSAKIVINFDMPVVNNRPQIETYLHRQGRCGRFGKNGKVISFVSNDTDYQIIDILQKEYGAQFIEITPDKIHLLNETATKK